VKICKQGNEYSITDLNSQNGTLYDGSPIPSGVVVPIEEGVPIAIGMSIIGLGEKCFERMAPFFESVGLNTEIASESGIFQVHGDKTNQRKLELIYKASKLLDENFPIEKTLELMLDYIFELLKNVDTGAFIVVDPGSEKILDVISKTTGPEGDRSTVYCPNVVRKVIENKKPLTISNVETEKEVDDITTLKILRIKSVLCAPLICNSHMMGVIYIDSREGAFAFSKEDISLFVDLCQRTAQYLVQAEGAFEITTVANVRPPCAPSML
jgi:transcriptional regulator with GAF, ATPase, and Fis domain